MYLQAYYQEQKVFFECKFGDTYDPDFLVDLFLEINGGEIKMIPDVKVGELSDVSAELESEDQS